jgi:hypothetical protein
LARQAVGDILWRLIDTSSARSDNAAPGVRQADLVAAVDRLERL